MTEKQIYVINTKEKNKKATEPTKITHDSLSLIFYVLHTVHCLTCNTFTNKMQ